MVHVPSDALSPDQRAARALENSLDLLAEAENADAFERGDLEDQAVETMVDGVARALVDGLNKPATRYAGQIAENSRYWLKTDLKQLIADRVEELESAAVGKEPLGEYIEDNLQKVVVHRSTDAKQGAKYTWDFGGYQVQTASGKDGRGHYNWPNFRNYIYEAGGPNLAKPDKERRSGDDWRDFMTKLIDDRGETRRIVGARTQAVDDLQRTIRKHPGYGTASGALSYSGIWIVKQTATVPEWWAGFGRPASEERGLQAETVDEVRLHVDLITEATDSAGITRDALYQEFDARSLTVPGSGGPSMVKYVDGGEERFWTLLPDVGVPKDYVPDPHARQQTVGTPIGGDRVGGDGTTETTDSAGFDGVGEIA